MMQHRLRELQEDFGGDRGRSGGKEIAFAHNRSHLPWRGIRDSSGLFAPLRQAKAAVNLPKAIAALDYMRYPSRGILSLSRRVTRGIASPFDLVFNGQSSQGCSGLERQG